MTNLEGQTFAGYEIIAKLGQGGMGAVYKARQPNLDRLAALKIMASELAADPDFVARFKREATAAANLSHPNIVQVYSAGESEGTHYIAMEFVDGVTLKQHIERQGRLDPREAIAITVLVAEALQYGWNKARLIHRDIKPDNIFLSQTGEVKVGDLGLAKTVGGGTTSLTQTGMMMGSPHYISPEQARGLSDIDFKADIYSLGCTLYHMLTGRPPYEGSDALAVIGKHVHEPPPAIFKAWPTCPIPVALVVGKMLAKQRHERPASYEDLIAQLREVHGKLKPVTAVAPVSASDPTQVLPTPAPSAPTPKPVVAKTPKPAPVKSRVGSRVPRVAIGIGVLAAMALIAGAVWWFVGRAGGTKLLDLGNGVKMELVAIPPGEFMLGSTKEERAWVAQQEYCGPVENEGEAPRKAAIKQGFWLGRTEVTMGQWKQFVNATGYKSEVERMNLTVWTYDPTQKKWAGRKGVNWRDPGFGFSMQDNHPVCCVTWNDAMAFCDWLTQREQTAGRLPAGYKIRLPTEAEWEYACRAGTQTRFWWGDSVEDAQGRVNWAGEDDGFECVHPVDHYGARGRNGFGLADMIGNVPEWCLERYDPDGAHEEFYPGSPDNRAMRGAAFWHLPGQSRCANRCGPGISGAWSGYGFRVCLGPDVLSAAAAAPITTAESRVTPAADASGYKPLFNGKDLTGWKVRENANNNWSAEGGVLVNSRSGADLITEETFTDFELHLEFKLPPQGNSGVYLRGRQELQLVDDCGQPAGLDTTGGIWGRIAPSENASKPVNEWQTLDVTLIGKEATVTINGRKVINAARISGVSTWAGLDNNVDQPGPIMLQGRLSAVSFRNIRIKPLPAAAAKADETKLLDLGGGVKMELVAIPPGEFMLGSTKEEQAWAVKNRLQEGDVKREGEAPRKATIKQGFWLGRTEVTVGQWKEFVTATGYKTDAEKKGYVDAAPRKGQGWGRADGSSWRDPGFGSPPQDNDPVCCVSWNDAMAFCEWATERERKAGRLAANQVVRLPTEAEWEYACRAGTQTKFWWGESKEDGKDRLNWSGKDDGYDFVAPVDSFGARGRNQFGLADMLGNVSEWCLDEYDAKQAHEECYKGNPGARVLRGGAFFFIPAICRCAYRSSGNSAILLAMFGFRVAVGADVPGSAGSAAQSRTGVPPVSSSPDGQAGRLSYSAALKQLGSVFTNAVGAEMVYIPPGEFMLGSTKEEQAWAVANRLMRAEADREGDQPRKTKIKAGFWLGRTEVTVGQWKQFAAATGYKTDAEKKGYADSAPLKGGAWGRRMDGVSWRDPGFGSPPQDNHPVCCVSWNDTVAFCGWLTEQERKAGRLPEGVVVRLPTEAEWEYACRAGTQTRFWWGDSAEDGEGRWNGAGKDDEFEFVSPVDACGERGRNKFGLADMSGNVWEWCLDEADLRQAHEECFKGNPGVRVFRGSAFNDFPAYARCAGRNFTFPTWTRSSGGFRVCLGPDVLGSAGSAAQSRTGVSPVSSSPDGQAGRLSYSAALKQLGSVFTNAVGAEMVYIPPGEFMLGSTKEEQAWAVADGASRGSVSREGNQPRRTSIPQAFWMGRTEVAVGQWKQFVDSTGYVTDPEKQGGAVAPPSNVKTLNWKVVKGANWRDPNFGVAVQDNHPVVCVSWNDAVAFCGWLHQREQTAGRLPPGHRIRLPTEAEWEYACRAGQQTKFWWGEAKEEGESRLNWAGTADGFEYVSPVDHHGVRGRNQFGLADMLGNVREWCLEEFGNKGERLVRGGSFYTGRGDVRCATRASDPPVRASAHTGFRVCLGSDVLGSAASAAPVTRPASLVPPSADAAWVPLDISAACNSDVIRTKGNSKAFGRSRTWATTGYLRDDGHDLASLPDDGHIAIPDASPVGFFQLHIPPGNDAILVSIRQQPHPAGRMPLTVTWDVPTSQQQRWANLAFLHASSTGDAEVSLIIRYDTGSDDNVVLHPWNWRPDERKESLVENESVAIKALDILRTKVEMFAETVPVDPKRVIKSLTFTFKRLSPKCDIPYAADDCIAGIFAISALPAAPSTPTLQHSNAPASADAAWQNAINLLPLIDPQKDAVGGKWKLQDGQLVSDPTSLSVIQIPYQPADEYDYRIEFVCPEGGYPVSQVLSKAGHPFAWIMGASNGLVSGFETVAGKGIYDNQTKVVKPGLLKAGQKCVSVVEVRNSGLRVYLDGQLVAEWKTNYSDMDIMAPWKLRDSTLLGVGCKNSTVFHRIEVREVTGKGTFTRAAPASAPNTPALQHSNTPAALSAFCAEVAALPAEQQVARVVAKLKELNPDFDPAAVNEQHTIENGAVVKLSLWSFGLSNLTPLRALLQLRDLSLTGTLTPSGNLAKRGSVKDLSPLSGMKPVRLILLANQVFDLTPLKEMPLVEFNCDWNSEISDLTPLSNMPLKKFSCTRTKTKDLSPLKSNRLTNLAIENTLVADLSPVADMPLRELVMRWTPVRDLSPLRKMPLQYLLCDDKLVTEPGNLAILREMATLRNICNKPVAEFWQQVEAGKLPGAIAADDAFINEVAALPAEQQVARVVAKLKELNPGYDGQEAHKIEKGVVTELSFSTVAVADISPVRALTRLKRLNCNKDSQGSMITDLSSLRGFLLSSLTIYHAPVKDLEPLQGMPLTDLNCAGSQVSDLSPLKGMPLNCLICYSTKVADLTPLRGMPLTILIMYSTSVTDLSPIEASALKVFWCPDVVAASPRNQKVLRSIKPLATINNLPAAEFWKKVEAGERPKP